MSLGPKAPYGSLLKGGPQPVKAERKARAATTQDGGHLDMIRKLPCVITGKRPADAAHVRYASKAWGKPITGMAAKPHDRWTVPLHRDVHINDQHRNGERGWWKKQGIDPLILAHRLFFEAAGDIEKAEQIVAETRAAMGGAK